MSESDQIDRTDLAAERTLIGAAMHHGSNVYEQENGRMRLSVVGGRPLLPPEGREPGCSGVGAGHNMEGTAPRRRTEPG